MTKKPTSKPTRYDGFQKVHTAFGTYMTTCWKSGTEGLVIIATENHKVPEFSLTHQATGMAVAYSPDMRQARNLAALLRGCCDWKAERPDFTREQLDAALGDFCHCAAYQWGASSGEPVAEGATNTSAP